MSFLPNNNVLSPEYRKNSLQDILCDQILHRNDYIADITQYEYCSRKYIVLILFIFWRLSHPRCFTWKFCYKCKKYIIGQTQFPRLLKRYNFYDDVIQSAALLKQWKNLNCCRLVLLLGISAKDFSCVCPLVLRDSMTNKENSRLLTLQLHSSSSLFWLLEKAKASYWEKIAKQWWKILILLWEKKLVLNINQ